MGNCLSRTLRQRTALVLPAAFQAESVIPVASAAHKKCGSVHSFLPTLGEDSSTPHFFSSSPTHKEGSSTPPSPPSSPTHKESGSLPSSSPTHKEGGSTPPSPPSSPTHKESGSTLQSLSMRPTHTEDGSTHSQSLHSNIKNKAYKAMLICHDKLVTALATDYLNVAGFLLARGFISDEISAKMLLPSSTPNEKATILVTAVREMIKNAPQQFPELMEILSEHTSTKLIVKSLQSAYQGELG